MPFPTGLRAHRELRGGSVCESDVRGNRPIAPRSSRSAPRKCQNRLSILDMQSIESSRYCRICFSGCVRTFRGWFPWCIEIPRFVFDRTAAALHNVRNSRRKFRMPKRRRGWHAWEIPPRCDPITPQPIRTTCPAPVKFALRFDFWLRF